MTYDSGYIHTHDHKQKDSHWASTGSNQENEKQATESEFMKLFRKMKRSYQNNGGRI